MEYRIRFANEKDAKAVHDIYGAYVPMDYVTFTVDNPDVESYRQKISIPLSIILFLWQKMQMETYWDMYMAPPFARTTLTSGM